MKSLALPGPLALLSVCLLSAGDVVRSEEPDLKAELTRMRYEHGLLKKTISILENKLTSNIIQQLQDKVVSALHVSNLMDASQFWSELLQHANSDTPISNLTAEIVYKAYHPLPSVTSLTTNHHPARSNFYPLLSFLVKENLSSFGFPEVYHLMKKSDHLVGGQEPFILANFVLDLCESEGDSPGAMCDLYDLFPLPVRTIVEGPVLLRNRDNRGYIIADESNPPCNSTMQCYGNPKTDVFIRKLPFNPEPETVISRHPGSLWSFLLPANPSEMEKGLHIFNEMRKTFLITKLRLTIFYLRNETSFHHVPYYEKELQAFYKPELARKKKELHVLDMDEEDQWLGIKIGVEEKHVRNLDYVHATAFGKKGDRLSLGRRRKFRDELDGIVWEVIKVEEDKPFSISIG